MAIAPRCDKCGAKLKKFGGILLSPPDSAQKVRKFHLCISCYRAIARSFSGRASGKAPRPRRR